MKFEKMWNHPEEGEMFEVEFTKKFVILLGPNGAGKTTMMRAIESEMRGKEDYRVVNDDAAKKGDNIRNVFDPQHLVATRFSSEGETLSYTLGTMLGKVRYHAEKEGKKTILCMDKADSGLSIDRIRELAYVLKKYTAPTVELIVMSANSYELANEYRDVAEYYWVSDKKFIELPDTYEGFISLYPRDEEEGKW